MVEKIAIIEVHTSQVGRASQVCVVGGRMNGVVKCVECGHDGNIKYISPEKFIALQKVAGVGGSTDKGMQQTMFKED